MGGCPAAYLRCLATESLGYIQDRRGAAAGDQKESQQQMASGIHSQAATSSYEKCGAPARSDACSIVIEQMLPLSLIHI